VSAGSGGLGGPIFMVLSPVPPSAAVNLLLLLD
jgi:hypothetical protein